MAGSGLRLQPQPGSCPRGGAARWCWATCQRGDKQRLGTAGLRQALLIYERRLSGQPLLPNQDRSLVNVTRDAPPTEIAAR